MLLHHGSAAPAPCARAHTRRDDAMPPYPLPGTRRSIFTPLKAARTLSGKNGQPPPKQSGFTAASVEAAKTLMTASQSDGIERTPALTLLGAERVAADSTRRYFHARDYKEQPFLSSKNYYDEDV